MQGHKGFLEYVKAAFLWRWNLLVLGAGIAFALLSGAPSAVLPLVAAAELLYLGLLCPNPRFQKAIDARRAEVRQTPQEDQEMLSQIRNQLKPDTWARFETLRNRCRALGNLAQRIRGPQGEAAERATDLQGESLERLLWMFLKLIYSHDAIEQFIRGMNRGQLAADLEKAESELKAAAAKERNEKLQRSLEDTVKTLQQRIANYDRAQENRELLAAEINRIEQKVNVISEMAISNRDSADISAQVDGIADGISATEEAMRKLDVTPLFERERTPRLLDKL